ncbi:unnamed protein product [Amoebophrya sp. A120]|nr:unnamed protein product [Amoebophrya sp. A120]|eukprot:GSA120T00025015001.1
MVDVLSLSPRWNCSTALIRACVVVATYRSFFFYHFAEAFTFYGHLCNSKAEKKKCSIRDGATTPRGVVGGLFDPEMARSGRRNQPALCGRPPPRADARPFTVGRHGCLG